MPRQRMKLTAEMVERCHRVEPDEGRYPPMTPLSDQDFAELGERLAAELGDEQLWLFAYGSLIWNPTFTAIEHRRGTAFGWHRDFSLQIQSFRGTRTQPGLMMALERGGQCDGVAYRLDTTERRSMIDALLRREISAHEDVAAIRWIMIATEQGPVRALVFWASPRGSWVVRGQPLERVAWVLARACGHRGSGAEYLYQTVLKLDEYGIRDRKLWRLQALVADEIEAAYPAVIP